MRLRETIPPILVKTGDCIRWNGENVEVLFTRPAVGVPSTALTVRFPNGLKQVVVAPNCGRLTLAHEGMGGMR